MRVPVKKFLIVEIIIFIVFFIFAISVHEGFTRHTNIQLFIEKMSSLFGMISNLKNNSHVSPVLSLLYAVIFFFTIILFIFYLFFIDFETMLVESKERRARFMEKEEINLIFLIFWALIFLVMSNHLGKYSYDGSYARYESLYLTKLGAATIGIISFSIVFPKYSVFHFRVIQLIRKESRS